jgi:hypothetical protein
VTARRLAFTTITEFVFAGQTRKLLNPGGPPTGRQLLRLNSLGALAVIEPGRVPPLTKGQAAGALDTLLRQEPM